MDSATRVRRRLAARVLAVAATLTMLVTGAQSAASGAATRSSTTIAQVLLLHETPFLGTAGELLGLSLSKTGPALAPHATVQLTIYSRLTTRSALTTAISGGGTFGPVSTTTPLPVACLASSGALRVALAVSPDNQVVTPRQLCGAVAPVLRLGCSASCDGVYPLRITVIGGGQVAQLVTLVTFAAVPSSTKLRVAWVLRVAGDQSRLAAARGVLRGLHAHPKVPATLDVEGSTIAAGQPTTGGQLSTALIREIAATPADELIGEPYVAADLGALRASRLNTEILRQFALDAVVLKSAGVPVAPVKSVTYGTGPQTPTMANAMATVGVRHLIVDGDALGVDPTTTLTWGDAFKLTNAPSGPSVLASDTELSALSDDTAQDPGLAAAEVLGELAFLHFEQPNLGAPRVVAFVTTATRQVGTSFVTTVLAGLARNPVLTPVSATEAFRAVPVGANGFPAVRSLVLGYSKPLAPSTISEIEHLRITTDALSSAVVKGDTPIPSIEGELLSAEQPMAGGERSQIMADVQHRLQLELGNFRIYDGPITLTESGASLPITVFSSAPYTVTGTLVLTSPRLTFPGLADNRVVDFRLDSSVSTTRVPARALVNGDLPLIVTLYSPDGRLVLARAEITVRATGFSYVGVVLTALAALVLAAWWIRTSRRRRAARS
jgi:hypothetical protein